MKLKCLAQEHNTVPRPGLEPGLLNPESSALTITPPHLPWIYYGTAQFLKPSREIKIGSIKNLMSSKNRFKKIVSHTKHVKQFLVQVIGKFEESRDSTEQVEMLLLNSHMTVFLRSVR